MKNTNRVSSVEKVKSALLTFITIGIFGSPFFIKTTALSDFKNSILNIFEDQNKYVVLAGAGDIASKTGKGMEMTSKILEKLATSEKDVAFFTLGDNVNETPVYYADYKTFFSPSWGLFKSKIHPAVGNHDYTDVNDGNKASGYFTYFGKAAGDTDKGYYSYNFGTWHIVVLNSNCTKAGGCSNNSSQAKWLTADLDKISNRCILAYWHHPYLSSGQQGGYVRMKDLWQILYDHHTDIVVNGHDHDYERFALQDPNGRSDSNGIREFVVGTGGKSLLPLRKRPLQNEEIRNDKTLGIIEFKLYPRKYEWYFIPVNGGIFTDSGTADCHRNESLFHL